jgi:hypothetical protein
MRALMFLVMLFVISSANASDLIQQFNSPVFNGNGYSSHALTIYQLEQSSRQRIRDDAAVARAQANAARLSDPVYQFMSNLNAMLYQQLAKQITDTMFGQSDATGGTVNFQGTNITWSKANDGSINLTIVSSSGATTTLNVPAGTFYF